MKGNTKGRTREGGTSVRARCGSRQVNRLDARLAAHQEYPVAADGSQFTNQKPRAKRPGSLNPRKH